MVSLPSAGRFHQTIKENKHRQMKDIADLIARIFIALIFIYEAYDSIGFYKETKEVMTEYGFTWQQDALLLGSIGLLVLGGVLVLIGYRSKFGAALLMVYFIPLTFIIHAFWGIEPSIERRIASIHFMKNIAIIGGLLMIFANGSGRYSIKRLFATTKV